MEEIDGKGPRVSKGKSCERLDGIQSCSDASLCFIALKQSELSELKTEMRLGKKYSRFACQEVLA